MQETALKAEKMRNTSHKHASINALNTELYDFDKILRRFKSINNIRLERTRNTLTDRQKEFLTLLPFLFHINHPTLPGFVSTNCPIGIPGFNPTKEMKFLAKRMAKSYTYKHQAYRQYDISSLYFMGSPGTIAYSQDSDFDIWLCYREDLSAKQIKELYQKTQIITDWAEEINLDVTIFLVNPKEFREGKYTPLSVESSGSTQQLLLLEEFYRTAILIAGRYPIWWIVPPEEEQNYNSYVHNLENKRLIFSNDYINLGSVADIPADEFFGATLWHIYKGIDSPYKSLLKLLLMEAYASEFPNIKLLSYEYKKHIYQDKELQINSIDPYLLIIKKLTSYLLDQQSNDRLELIRQCFYLKVQCPISKKSNKAEDEWRIEIMKELISDWNWDSIYVRMLDYQVNWKVSDVISEQKKLVDALTYSYKKLSDFFRQHHNVSRISQRDLHILGRKLYAAFERKAGKIEIINRQYKNQLLEKQISIHQFISSKKMKGWKLFLGVVGLSEVENKDPLNQSAYLMKLISWLYFNKVINQFTNFLIYDEHQNRIPEQEIICIINSLNVIYPNNSLAQATIDILSKPSFVENSCLYINVGVDPFRGKKKNTSQVATSRTDSFKYGAMHKNLILSIDLIFNSSWKEVMFFHYQGQEGILDCICQFLRWNSKFDQPAILPTLCNSFSSPRGDTIAKRLNEVINDIIITFHQAMKASQRYVFAIEKAYYLIWYEGDDPHYKKLENYRELITNLSNPSREFNSLTVEKQATDDLVLPAIYKKNKADQVQFFYYNHTKNVDIYILDNFGDLYYQRLAIEQQNVHINHYILFLNSIINRLQFDPSRDMTLGFENDINLSIYQMSRQSSSLTIRKQQANQFPLPKQFLNIQAIGDLSTQHFSIFCDDTEFSALDYGNNVYHELASYVVNNRPSGLRYPIYITDMDLSTDLMESEGFQSIHISQLLKYKQLIEKKLNLAIKQI
ncbi:MAG: class I adenylate cyclase [Pseudomonadota bacterium]